MRYIIYMLGALNRHPQAGFETGLGRGVNAAGETWHLCRHNLDEATATSRLATAGVTWKEVGVAPDAEVMEAAPWLRDCQATKIRAVGEAKLQAMAGPYMRGERETWTKQAEQAEAYQKDPTAPPGKMLANMAAGRGITVAKMASLIMENATRFEPDSGTILGTQQAILDRVYDPVLPLIDVLNIVWE